MSLKTLNAFYSKCSSN